MAPSHVSMIAAAVQSAASPAVLEQPDLESSTEQYALRFAGPAGRYLLDVQTRILLDLARPWPGASVLDVGGGHAQCAAPLARAGHRVTVLGTHPNCFTRPRRLCPPGVEYEVGDLINPPFPPQSFDIVVCFRIMPHVRDWRQLIRGLSRIARHALILDFPSTRSINALTPLLFSFKKRIEGDTRNYEMMRRSEVSAELRAGGFHAITARPQFFFPMVLHRAIARPPISRALEAPARALQLTRAFGSPVILHARRAP